MGNRKKRSFDDIEGSSVGEYVYSESERRKLKKMALKRPKFDNYLNPINQDLDLNTKIAALKASVFVVSLVAFSGEVLLSQSSGAIIETEENSNIVITSLHLVRKPSKTRFVVNKLAKNLKIVVRSYDEKSYIGEIVTFDFHYNLLIIKFVSTTPLEHAKLSMMDDDVVDGRSFELRPHGLKVKHEDPVIAVGRYFYKTFDFMGAPGRFRKIRCNSEAYGCRELLRSSCKITRCGDGAPLINLRGEVIGIGFYELGSCTPFLPINIAFKLWDHYKNYQELRHPSYGFEAGNLYMADLPTLEMVIKRFPTMSNGVLVEKVQEGSYAECAGLRKDDVITKCDGKTVKSFLELWGLLWDKVGDVAELEVARVGRSSFLSLDMSVGEATPNELNKWPLYDYC